MNKLPELTREGASRKLAWLLATSADEKVRDGAEALKHASFMIQAPGVSENPSLLGTLAATQAAAGNFQDATRTTDRLISILDGNGMTEQAKTHRLRRKRFQAGETLSQ